MLIEPEALIMFADRAGLKLWRDGKILLIEFKGGLSDEWKAVLRQNKAALLPIIPEVPPGLVGKPTKAMAVPARETYDLFGPVPEQPKRPAKEGRLAKAMREDKSSA
ncbi:hypothetical protein GPROT1_02772 [Gammaproteobacteria bacterium]|nr:hypothetical protein GPROT1_02772 [Gammaproteobacteria bacterium]